MVSLFAQRSRIDLRRRSALSDRALRARTCTASCLALVVRLLVSYRTLALSLCLSLPSRHTAVTESLVLIGIDLSSFREALVQPCARKAPALASMAGLHRLTKQSMQRLAFVLLLCTLSKALALTTRPLARAPSHLFRRTRGTRSGTRRGARKPSAPPIEQTEPTSSRRNVLAAVAFPVAVGLGSQAPLLGLIANPPDAAARDEMLSSWCAADYCTLLGGGAGYGGASAFPGNYVEPDDEAK